MDNCLLLKSESVHNQSFFAFKVRKIYVFLINLKKAIDKSNAMGYNSIVNSKGAADDKSAAPFLVYSANSMHKGVYEVDVLLRPFILYLSHNNGVWAVSIKSCKNLISGGYLYGLSDNLTTGVRTD